MMFIDEAGVLKSDEPLVYVGKLTDAVSLEILKSLEQLKSGFVKLLLTYGEVEFHDPSHNNEPTVKVKIIEDDGERILEYTNLFPQIMK